MSDAPRPYHRLLAGAALGVGTGDLLLGLNPPCLEPAAAVRLLSFCLAAGLLLAAPTVGRGRGRSPSPQGWIALGGMALLLALLAESQRRLYYLSLGNGTRRLLVAVSLVSAVATVAYLAAAFRRPDPRAARFLLGAHLVLLALVPLSGRRAPEREVLARALPTPRTPSRGILVVGIEGASWELVTAGAADGSLPVLARLLREGVAGPVATLAPYDRDSAWITAATGKRPSKHGVVSAVRFETPAGSLCLVPRLPHGEPPASLPFSRTIPLAGSGRRSLTFWEILAARGREAAVLDWPAAPARDGLLLWAPEAMFDGESGPASGRPEATALTASLFRVGISRLDHYLVASLEPAGLPPEDRERALEGAARDLSVAGASLAAIPTGTGSVSALVLTGLAAPARVWGPAAGPSRYWGLTLRASEPRGRALLAYYRFLDELIGDLMEREGRERTVCVFSPVGFGPPPPRTAVARFVLGREPLAAPDAAHAGFVILAGSGIRAGARLTSASVFDLAPTLLALAGAPVARDLDGRVLAEAFDERFAETTSIPIVLSFEPGGPQ